jgi:kynurenine formamidase
VSWSPPNYEVDADGKVVGAPPPEPNNWGRWGEDDQRGTANLVTPELVARAASLVRSGEVFSLAIPISSQAPFAPARLRPTRLNTITGTDYLGGFTITEPAFGRGAKFTDDLLIIHTHGSTQWDGLSHVISGEAMYNGFWGGSVTAVAGATRNGIQHLKESLVGRGVLLDVCAAAGGEPLAKGQPITAQTLDAVADAQGVEVHEGDILFVRTGYLGLWYTLDHGPEKSLDWYMQEPGLAIDTVPWLHEHGVAAIACDNWGVEVVPLEDPSGPAMPFHQAAIAGLGLTLGEFFWLDDLAAACAGDDRWEFFAVAPPLNITNAAGSMLNPVAIR